MASWVDQPTWDGNRLACTKCGSQQLSVVDSRAHKGTIRRQRLCKNCGKKFHTCEIICDLDCKPIFQTIVENVIRWIFAANNLRTKDSNGTTRQLSSAAFEEFKDVFAKTFRRD